MSETFNIRIEETVAEDFPVNAESPEAAADSKSLAFAAIIFFASSKRKSAINFNALFLAEAETFASSKLARRASFAISRTDFIV